MKFTIITVAYNSARTIGDTLRSVAAQTYPDIEHLVIDGASKDTTLEQVRVHGKHVARLISEPDRGIYDAMNKGLGMASGEWIGFLNADDMFASPDSVAQLAAAAMPEAVNLLYGDLDYVEEVDTTRVVRQWRSGSFEPRQLRYGWMPPHPTFYVRRERFGHERFNTRYRIAADYDYMLRCLLRPEASIAHVPHVLVHMRNGGASNRSAKALWRKSREDLAVMRAHGVGNTLTLLAKNFRKLPQFFAR
jgi:glycosyltransferase